MIKMVIKKLKKTISVFSVIIFLISCSTSKNIEKNLINRNPNIIKDYISEFSTVNLNENLYAIILRKDEKSNIVIKDIPKKAALGFLNEKNDFNNCMFSGILCFYKINELSLDGSLFYKVSNKLIQKAKEKNKIIIGGKEVFYSNELMEWHSALEIIYDLNNNKKIVKNLLSSTEHTTLFD